MSEDRPRRLAEKMAEASPDPWPVTGLLPYATALLAAEEGLDAALYDLEALCGGCECDSSANVRCSSCRARSALTTIRALLP